MFTRQTITVLGSVLAAGLVISCSGQASSAAPAAEIGRYLVAPGPGDVAGTLRFFADGSSALSLGGTLVDGSRVSWSFGSAEPLPPEGGPVLLRGVLHHDGRVQFVSTTLTVATDGGDLVFTGALPLGSDGRAQPQPTRIRLTADLSAGPAGPLTSAYPVRMDSP